MNSSSPMKPLMKNKGRFKLYYADQFFTKPGVYLWTGKKHIRILPIRKKKHG